MDLRADSRQIDPGYGNPEYLKGWTRRGFPGLVGFAWYRLRLHVVDPYQPLSIKMPDHVDDAYQVFANGQYLGEFGHFTPARVECFRSRTLTFTLPHPDEHGDLLLAIRFYMEPFVLVGGTTGDSGGMHQAPVIGLPSQIESMRAAEHTGRILSVITSVFVSCFMLIGAVGAFWIWLIDRSRRTFLWLGVGMVLVAAPNLMMLIAFFTFAWTQTVVNQVTESTAAIGVACWVYFWRDWFGLSRSRWMQYLPILMAIAGAATELGVLVNTHIPVSVVLLAMQARMVFKFALGILLFVELVQGAREDRVGAWLALPPILLLTVSQFSSELINWAHIRTSVFPFGIQITVKDVALVLLVLVTGALAVRRFIGSQVSQRLERQTIDQELEQARELQQRVLVPEENTSAHFAVETAYHPARTVGGDFFQVIPYPDGSVLVVVGDVSGKGMAAAMLVAVVVGAIRTRADETSDPAEILRTLNERLLGRAGSHFATCVAAHLSPRGHMTVANAGHLPPYVNGVALDLPGSVPLGILPGSRPDLETVNLAPGDYLSFLTDGVLEARNAAGQLLGFEQTARLSSQPVESIAHAAIQHGQDDDITVVGVRVASMASEVKDSHFVQVSPA
jgi:serine phosphatase RsbU (regulator of sigma subunit)